MLVSMFAYLLLGLLLPACLALDTTSCGSTKSCVAYPSGCVPTSPSCLYFTYAWVSLNLLPILISYWIFILGTLVLMAAYNFLCHVCAVGIHTIRYSSFSHVGVLCLQLSSGYHQSEHISCKLYF